MATESLMELLTTSKRDYLLKGKEQVKVTEALEGKKVIGLYFSAHWCPPCRRFTPELVKVYNELKKQHGEFEVVFLSSDRSKEAFEEYFGEMPWLAVPHADETKAKLSEKFGVQGIPSLQLLHPDGKLITAEGRSAVSEDGAKGFPWVPARVRPLSDREGGVLNGKTCLIALLEEEAEETQNARIAELMQLGEQKDNEAVELLYATQKGGMAERIRSFVGIEGESATALILNLGEDQKFLMPAKDKLGEGEMAAFLDKFHKCELKPTLKSAPRPAGDADPAHTGLTIVVGSSFEELVLDQDTNVFLDVYADWCGPCVAVKPHLLRVAQALAEQKVKGLRVAKLDSDKNDVDKKYIPETYIPVLKFFPAGKDQTPIKFEGSRDADGILDFLHKQLKDSESSFDLKAAKDRCAALLLDSEQQSKSKANSGA
jgi:thiol-disulfide isomerase/thioredoxin